MGRVFATKDFLAGLMFVAFGLFGLWLGRSLEAGSASAMEAGYFPRLVCCLLVVLGAALATVSLWRGGGEVPERGMWRPFAFITMSALAFALLLRPLGLVLDLAISITLARFATGGVRPVPLLLLCLVLIASIVGIFVIALHIVIPLWPAAF